MNTLTPRWHETQVLAVLIVFLSARVDHLAKGAKELSHFAKGAKELRAAGYSFAELREANFSVSEVFATKCTWRELSAAGFSVEEAWSVGFPLQTGIRCYEDGMGPSYHSDLVHAGAPPAYVWRTQKPFDIRMQQWARRNSGSHLEEFSVKFDWDSRTPYQIVPALPTMVYTCIQHSTTQGTHEWIGNCTGYVVSGGYRQQIYGMSTWSYMAAGKGWAWGKYICGDLFTSYEYVFCPSCPQWHSDRGNWQYSPTLR